jgi:hypothetical protein
MIAGAFSTTRLGHSQAVDNPSMYASGSPTMTVTTPIVRKALA